MNNSHLNDRQLQRYLNRTCSELEYKKSGKHIQGCSSCRSRLYTYLEMESLLDQVPLLTAPPALGDRIMQSVYADSTEDSGNLPETPASPSSPISFVSRRRSELIHGLIAVAATYLFINSGILGKIMSINADHWGAGVQDQVAAIGSVVTRISIQLLS